LSVPLAARAQRTRARIHQLRENPMLNSIRSTFNHRSLRLAAAGVACSLAFAAQAHNAWLMPSSTVLSAPQWITVDAAVTTDPFIFDHTPLGVEKVVVTAPDGKPVEVENVGKGKLRSTFDLDLQQKGTYKIAIANDGVFASYKVDGQQKRWRGNAADLDKELPANATDVNVTQSSNRLETFVTVGAPTQQVLKPTGAGLELIALTHPNDLVKGEVARFRFDIDGKPAPNLEVTLMSSGSRYRTTTNERPMKTDANGVLQISWTEPGMYYIGATARDDKTTVKQAKERRLGYAATVEVLP
jgi:uncharacterized GH25 family protein